MKKVIAIISALAMTASMALTAGAAEENPITAQGNSAKVPITITTQTAETPQAAAVISVAVAGTLEFEYKPADNSAPVWNPDTHKYSASTPNAGQGTWTNETQVLTVTNHSNVDITIQPVVTNNTGANNTEFSVSAIAAASSDDGSASGTDSLTLTSAARASSTAIKPSESGKTGKATTGTVTIKAAVSGGEDAVADSTGNAFVTLTVTSVGMVTQD